MGRSQCTDRKRVQRHRFQHEQYLKVKCMRIHPIVSTCRHAEHSHCQPGAEVGKEGLSPLVPRKPLKDGHKPYHSIPDGPGIELAPYSQTQLGEFIRAPLTEPTGGFLEPLQEAINNTILWISVSLLAAYRSVHFQLRTTRNRLPRTVAENGSIRTAQCPVQRFDASLRLSRSEGLVRVGTPHRIATQRAASEDIAASAEACFGFQYANSTESICIKVHQIG